MKPSEFAIVPMEAVHVEAVAALEAETFSAPWSDVSIAGELTNPLSLWLVALDGEAVVGYVGSQAVLDEADMMNLAVKPSHRRCGIAGALVKALTQALRTREVHSLTLEVRATNEGAIALYRACGFSQVGRRPRYYTKPTEDALILRKEWKL